ncbi:MAG TPA: hypothetical protein PKY82_07265 [Pyrinomonadaceae bacterium]|nr:hypothetical protein [Pyrinomonadaceae bacterium]
MSMTNTEIFGFSSQFIQLLQDNKTDLQTKGLDVTNWITELSDQRDDAVGRDRALDDMRAALKVKTAETNTAVTLVYKNSSTRLDAVIGVLGKDTPLAKQAARLRSSIIKQSKKRKETEDQPTG